MRVALYARVSRDDQHCEQQLTALREYATARKWTVAGEYVDQGLSGAKASRPELDRLMSDAAARRIDCVLVWKIDRFGRSVLHLNQQLNALASHGVRFIATTQNLDTDESNATSRLLFHILSAVAEFEREMIRERTYIGIDRARREGKTLGRPVIIADRQRVWDLRAAGLTLTAIATETGLKRATVHRICRLSAENQPTA